eukprot:3348391-Pyramimonas_sp.AAC.2
MDGTTLVYISSLELSISTTYVSYTLYGSVCYTDPLEAFQRAAVCAPRHGGDVQVRKHAVVRTAPPMADGAEGCTGSSIPAQLLHDTYIDEVRELEF